MDEAYEQALRLVRDESVQPLVTTVFSEFREWKLHCRNTRTAAEGKMREITAKVQRKASGTKS